MDKFIELLKALHGDEVITDELVKGMENMPDAQVKELEESLGVINEYRRAYPDEILDAIKMLSKHALNGRIGGKGDELTLEDAIDFVLTDEDEKLEKAGKKVSKEMKAKLIKIMNIIKEIVGDEDDETKKKSVKFTKNDDLPEDIQEKLKKLALLEKEKEDEDLKKSKEAQDKKDEQLKQALTDIEMLKAGTGVRLSFDPENLTEEEKKEMLKSKTIAKYPSLMGRINRRTSNQE